MEAIYFLLGEADYLIKQQIESYKMESNIDPFNIVNYDATESSLNEILQELNTSTLFSETKMVIIHHIDFLTKHSEEELKSFIRYLEKPSEDSILILVAPKMDVAHPLYIALEKFAYIEFIKNIEFDMLPQFIKKLFENDGYLIDNQGVGELINRTQGDLMLLSQEIEKLKMFTLDEKRISKLEVELLVNRTLEDNIFNFSSAYLKGQTQVFMSIYNDLIENKIQVTTLFNHLFQTIYLIYQTQNLLKNGMNQEQIANYLNISTGRAYYVIKEAKDQNSKRIEKTIKDLAKLDILIKSGQQDDKLGFELMLLGNLK